MRDMSWEDYGISKNRYRELKAFCLQYEEKKTKIHYGLPSTRNDGMPGGSLSTRSPVEQQAIDNAMYMQDIRMIEEAAVRTDPTLWQYILKSVTQDLKYEFIQYDKELGHIPVSRNEFYGLRRKFYYNLNEIKKRNWGTN
jgi:hypothetical protein